MRQPGRIVLGIAMLLALLLVAWAETTAADGVPLEVIRRACKAREHPENPVIRGDKPWEFNQVYSYGAAIHDEQEKLFKAWYKANTRKSAADVRNPGYQIRILYAQSQDGVHWEKPDLGSDPLYV